MLCYAMLRYDNVMPCCDNAMLCSGMLCYANANANANANAYSNAMLMLMLRYAMLCYDMLCYAML